MTRSLPRLVPAWLVAVLLFGLAVPGGAAAPPIRITGRLVPPAGGSSLPAGARIELHPASPGFVGTVRRLGGAPEPAPLASVQVRTDGTFEVTAPGPGFYRVVARAEGRLDQSHDLVPLVEDRELEPLALPAAGRLRVKVVGTGGEPLSGLEIVAKPSSFADSDWRPAPRRGVTGADGRLELPRASGEVLSLAVLTPAFLGWVEREVRGDQITLKLRPRPLARLEVRGPDGRPAAGALVRWDGCPLGATGPRGRFAVAAPADRPLSIETAAGERAEIAPERLAGPAAGLLAVQLVAPKPTGGRVVDAATGEPVAGALVWTFLSRLNAPPAVSGADGGFHLLRPVEKTGPAWVWAAAPGYLDGLSSEPGAEGRRIALAASTALAGSVVDAESRPVARVQVEARSRGVRRPPVNYTLSPAVAWSRPDGSFRLAGLVAGGDHELIVRADGFAPAVIVLSGEALPRAGHRAAPLRIVLSQGQTASGRIVDPEGRPVQGAEVLLVTMTQGYEKLTFYASSDGSGRFEVRRLIPGRLAMVVSHPAFSALRLPGVEIAAGARADLGVMTMEAGALLEGRVTDRRDQPLAGAQVFLRSAGEAYRRNLALQLAEASVRGIATTDATGSFKAVGLRTGERYELQVSLPGYHLEGEVSVLAPSAQPLRLVLTRSRSLAGRVVGPAGGPVPGVTVTAWRGQKQESRKLGWSRSEEEGEFRIQGLSPGPLRLVVSDFRGVELRSLEGLELAEEHDLGGVEVMLERDPDPAPVAPEVGDWDAEAPADRPERATVTGRLLGVVPGDLARVQVGASQSGSSFPGEVLAGGTYRIRDLGPGEWEVEAVRDSGRPVRGPVRVEPGVSTEGPDLDLSGLTLTGRVLVDGEPAAGAAIRVLGPRGLREVAVTAVAHDGRFRLVGLASGASLLRVITPYGTHFHTIELQADLDLPLALATGRLTGHVLSVGGQPVAGARVTLSSMDWGAEGVRTDEQGAFSIPRAFAGDQELSVVVDGRPLFRFPVEIQPGESSAELRLPGAR